MEKLSNVLVTYQRDTVSTICLYTSLTLQNLSSLFTRKIKEFRVKNTKEAKAGTAAKIAAAAVNVLVMD